MPKDISEAARLGDITSRLTPFIAAGVDVNAVCQAGPVNTVPLTPLHAPLWDDHKEIIELLIAAGADVNAKVGSGFSYLANETAILGHKEIVELLIAGCAGVGIQKHDGNALLDWTARSWDPFYIN